MRPIVGNTYYSKSNRRNVQVVDIGTMQWKHGKASSFTAVLVVTDKGLVPLPAGDLDYPVIDTTATEAP